MAIHRIKVSNFKSFDELDVELRPLNIVVGGNAAGKSNFLEIFRFVRDLAAHGLENAVSLQGGMEYLTNLGIGLSQPVSFELVLESSDVFSDESDLLRARVFEAIYRLSFESASGTSVLGILQEQVVHKCSLWDGTSRNLGRGEIVVSLSGQKVKQEFLVDRSFGDSFWSKREFRLPLEVPAGTVPPPGEVFLGKGSYFLPNLASDIAVLDLEPKLSKRATSVTGKIDLEPDGSNLAIVLRKLLQDEPRWREFVRLLKQVLPFVEDLRVERFADKSLLIALRERYAHTEYLPASFLSDGTIHLIALILALYFERAPVTIIEEPERNVHPHLISKVAAMMKDASRQKQVIATTHNPELVKHVDLEDLLLVHRDEQGFSRISRPAESEELRVFLENDLGVDELYVQNLLGVGHGV